jgi:hypothetical protein
VSKAYGVACFMTTAAYYLGLYDRSSIELNYGLVIKSFQVSKLLPKSAEILQPKFICSFMFPHDAGLEASYEFLLSWAIFISFCFSSATDVRYLSLPILWNHMDIKFIMLFECWK